MIEMSWRLYVAWQQKNASKNTAPEINATFKLQLGKLNGITEQMGLQQCLPKCMITAQIQLCFSLVHFKTCYQNNQQRNGQRSVKISKDQKCAPT